jgi:hypothetical protein
MEQVRDNVDPDGFVSYARRDAPFVRRLVADLARRGVQLWWDQNLVPGSNWQRGIESALGRARFVLFIASEASSTSEWVRSETAAAQRAGTLTIPLIIDDTGPAAIPEALREIQWVDFRDNYEGALERLLEALPGTARSAQPVEELPETSKGYVFLSYAEEDAPFVEDVLKPTLSGRSVTFWEFRSAERRYETSIARELEDRIDNALAVVAILSPDWKSADWTERELLYAEAVDRPRFLVLARPMPPSILTVGKLVIDFTVDPDAAASDLVGELRKKGL